MLAALLTAVERLGRRREGRHLSERLGRMTDRQLADIGLSRHEVPAFARLATRDPAPKVTTVSALRHELLPDLSLSQWLIARAISLRSA
jgi:uncharacterized protein YjiS (DUF1127 family)